MEGVKDFILSTKRNHRTDICTESPTKNIRNLPVLSRDLRYFCKTTYIEVKRLV